MPKGTVKWFNATKGYGFIQPQSGGKDVFVHISAVERAGLTSLNEGQVIEYEEVSNKGKTGRHPTTAASTGLLVFAFCHIPARHRHTNGKSACHCGLRREAGWICWMAGFPRGQSR
jgi:cold shock protein